jgi:hypothetical protein
VLIDYTFTTQVRYKTFVLGEKWVDPGLPGLPTGYATDLFIYIHTQIFNLDSKPINECIDFVTICVFLFIARFFTSCF